MSVVVATFPEVHEEEGHGSEDDEDKGEIVAGLLVAGVKVEVTRGWNPQQYWNTPRSLNKTPTSGEIFGANPGNISLFSIFHAEIQLTSEKCTF